MSAAPRKRKPASERRRSKDRDAARVRSALTGGAMRASAYDAQPEGRPSESGTAGSGPTPAGRAGDATPGPALQPPDVSRGLKTHLPKREPPPNGVFVRLDWLRATTEEQNLERVLRFCADHFGSKHKPTKGPKHFKFAERWAQGAQVSWGHSASRVMLDIHGDLLSRIDGHKGMDLLRAIWNLGWKITRLDGAIDSVGQNRSIVDNVRASCLANELCRMRYFKEGFAGQSVHDRSEKCMNVGRREAQVCARVYDKGLEQKWCISDWWERIEVEWKGERALVVAAALVHAGEGWSRGLVERIVGAFDFREQNGRSELKRRPRVKWWADLLEGLEPTVTRPIERDPEIRRWIEGLRRSYGAVLLAIKDATGWSWDDLLRCLLTGVDPKENSLVVDQFLKQFPTPPQIAA